MAENNSGRGSTGMNEDEQSEIASKGGQNKGSDGNSGNFANDPQRAAEAGQKGGEARGGGQGGNQ